MGVSIIRSRKLFVLGVLGFMVIGMGILGIIARQPGPSKEVRPQNLLEVIAKGESRGNYNAYYGNARNQSIDFTKMTVKEVLAWQAEYVDSGSPSSAVGKYQFIRPTLEGLVKEKGIDKNALFDQELQDKLAIALLERRGLDEYLEGKIDREKFAHNLSKEWAALPKVVGEEPDKSFYDGDGLNKARTSVEEVYSGIEKLEEDIDKDKKEAPPAPVKKEG